MTRKIAHDFPTALEKFSCCFGCDCSLLLQAQTGAVTWARCKCRGTDDERKVYTTGESPGAEDSFRTEGRGG